MFNQLFSRSDALTRQLSAPLVEERRQYLAECASQGMSRTTLRAKSLLLLSIVDHLKTALASRRLKMRHADGRGATCLRRRAGMLKTRGHTSQRWRLNG